MARDKYPDLRDENPRQGPSRTFGKPSDESRQHAQSTDHSVDHPDVSDQPSSRRKRANDAARKNADQDVTSE